MFYSVFKKLQCKIDLEQVDLCFFFYITSWDHLNSSFGSCFDFAVIQVFLVFPWLPHCFVCVVAPSTYYHVLVLSLIISVFIICPLAISCFTLIVGFLMCLVSLFHSRLLLWLWLSLLDYFHLCLVPHLFLILSRSLVHIYWPVFQPCHCHIFALAIFWFPGWTV